MKNYLYKAICLAALTMTTLPIVANDYLKIYFKDGHTERHYMKLVESISATKYDLDGNLHDDYQMQQIVMKDTTFSYYIADIDSMTFRKVDEEKLKERIETVQSALEPIIQNSSSLEDVASHIDEIKRIDGVEDAYHDGDDLVIKIYDWFDIVICNEPLPSDIDPSLKQMARHNTRSHVPTASDGSKMKATISFQMIDDPDFDNASALVDDIDQGFSTMGYETNYVLGNKMDLSFFYKQIFDSNVLLIDTHGRYGPLNKKHSLRTGIEVDHVWSTYVGSKIIKEMFNSIDVVDIDMDDVYISYGNHGDGNLLGLKPYWYIREDFIKKSPYRFSNAGPHVVFVAACSSLEGNNILTHRDGLNIYGSDSFAQIFFDKGADVYIGYNEGTYRGSSAAAQFFLDFLLRGCSVEQAIKYMDPLYLYESDKDYQACLVDLYNEKSNNPKGIFIVNTHTVEKAEQAFSSEYKNNKQVKLEGTTLCSDLERTGIDLGFRIATEPDVDTSSKYTNIRSKDAHYTGTGVGEVAFSAQFDPEPGKTYYYRACTYDGLHFNWGEEKTFQIEKPAETGIITFADQRVKELCVKKWDTNGDGELSKEEAAAVKDLGTLFKYERDISSFNELQYFTGLTSIGKYAFDGCNSLTSIVIPNSVTSIGYEAFSFCRTLTSISIPNSVTSIGSYAFKYCEGLTSITIPNSVTSIGSYAFYECSGLTSVAIGSSVTSIGSYAFEYCKGLTSISIPNSVTSLGDGAFYECSGLTSVTIGSSVTSIGEEVFYHCKNLTSITIPNGVTSIGKSAFNSCSSLTSIAIPNSVTSIGEIAFVGCKSLTSITIPNGVKKIGDSTFSGCRGLTSITIPNSVTSIGWHAFESCNSVTSITIGSGVVSISSDVFTWCNKLTDVYCLAENIQSADTNAFSYSPVESATLHVPAASLDNYKDKRPWKYFGTIVGF